MLTNDLIAIKIEDTDRRICIQECNKYVLNISNYFTQLYSVLEDNKCIYPFFKWLYDITDPNYVFNNNKIKTKTYNNIKSHQQNIVGEFMLEYLSILSYSNYKKQSFSISELYLSFDEWRKKYYSSLSHYNRSSFSIKLSETYSKYCVKSRKNTDIYFVIYVLKILLII